MKLIAMDKEYVGSQLSSTRGKKLLPEICFSKSVNALSRKATELLQLKDNDRIILVYDADNPKDLYLTLHENGFEIRIQGRYNQCRFNCSAYYKLVTELFHRTLPNQKSYRFRIAAEPELIDGTEYWAILTTAPAETSKSPTANKKEEELFDPASVLSNF